MNKSYKDLLEKYLDRTISTEELNQLHELLEQDKELQYDFDRHRLAINTVRQAELRNELTAVMQKQSKTQFWAWAAIFVLAMTIALYFVLRPPLAERLYAANYTTYPNMLVMRDGGESNLQKGYATYALGNFKEAITIMRKSPEYLKGDGGALFYVGLSLMELGQYNEAVNELSQIGAGSEFYEIARWYQALALLIVDPDQSKEVFKDLAAGNYNNDKAARILRRLR